MQPGSIQTDITINFEKSDFPHLIGLYKLIDILNGNIAIAKLFEECISGKITYGQTKMTLLYKEKICKKTCESVIQYDRLYKS